MRGQALPDGAWNRTTEHRLRSFSLPVRPPSAAKPARAYAAVSTESGTRVTSPLPFEAAIGTQTPTLCMATRTTPPPPMVVETAGSATCAKSCASARRRRAISSGVERTHAKSGDPHEVADVQQKRLELRMPPGKNRTCVRGLGSFLKPA